MIGAIVLGKKEKAPKSPEGDFGSVTKFEKNNL
jgi:hypothetical protein